MADEILIFDAAASGISGEDPGSPLSIGPGTSYNLVEHDYPAPALSILYASSIDTEGELAAAQRYENRTISIKLDMVDAAGTLLAALQAKVAKLQREGGTLKRTMKNGDVRTYDLVAANGWSPVYDLKYYLGDLTEVSMQLPALPFSRGAEVDLGDNVETTLPVLIFTEASVPGDVPALGRLVIDNDDASNTQRLLRWGIQSRYYSSASTAALFYQAESCALGLASAAAGPAGASGTTAFYGSLTPSPAWSAALLYVGASSTAQTHVGSFRVMARVRAPAANTGVASLRLSYKTVIGGAQASNDSVALPREDVWFLVDLGQVTLPPARTGTTQGWLGWIEGQSTSAASDDIYIDYVSLVPVTEGYGENLDITSTPQILVGAGATIRHDGAFANASGGYQPPLKFYEGDLLTVPPSGAESRTLRVLVKLADGDVFSDNTSACFADYVIGDLSARLFVTPRYLT